MPNQHTVRLLTVVAFALVMVIGVFLTLSALTHHNRDGALESKHFGDGVKVAEGAVILSNGITAT